VFQGSFKRVLAVSVEDPSLHFIAKLPATATVQPGDRVAISCDTDQIILLTD
ncbi:TOBE domain-containing protein, partial [Mesorhizobium sp. M7A.F.Ca.US.005.03.2.1]